jgi:hypothetical protein
MVTGTLGYAIGKWLMDKGERVRVPQSTVDRESFALVRQ